jgi:hydrogenase maturation protease
MKTIIVGLGNPILSDDGVGVRVAYEIEAKLGNHIPVDGTITEAGVGGLRLMELLEGYDRAIIIDAIQTKNGHPPGTVLQMDLDYLRSISPTQHSASAHDTSLVLALDAGKYMDMKLPDEVIIFAVEVINILEFGDTPTPAVADAIPKVADMVLDIL